MTITQADIKTEMTAIKHNSPRHLRAIADSNDRLLADKVCLCGVESAQVQSMPEYQDALRLAAYGALSARQRLARDETQVARYEADVMAQLVAESYADYLVIERPIDAALENVA